MGDWIETAEGTFYNLDQVQIVAKIKEDGNGHKEAGKLEIIWADGGCCYVPVENAQSFLEAMRARATRRAREAPAAKMDLSDHEFVEPCSLPGYPVQIRVCYSECMRGVTLEHARRLLEELTAVIADADAKI